MLGCTGVVKIVGKVGPSHTAPPIKALARCAVLVMLKPAFGISNNDGAAPIGAALTGMKTLMSHRVMPAANIDTA